MSNSELQISVRLMGVRFAAKDICFFDFEAPDGGALPGFTAGSHIDLHLPNGIIRQYSLISTGGKSNRYSIAVKRDPQSRGGSIYLHHSMHVGDIYSISAPRNLFPLDRDAAHSVLIAGGIGITPMISMAFELGARQQPFDLYYAFRSADERIPLGELENLASVHFHDDMASGGLLDIPRIVDAGAANSHFYCCGPKGMLTAFESSTASLDAGRAHVEYFSPKDTPSSEHGFAVELALTGREFFVPPGMSILDVLRDAGVDVSSSCEEGICGACETQVIEGDPLHRDSILTKAEQSAGKKMMICCSGCKGDRLVLHL